jgi:hypothetical protein
MFLCSVQTDSGAYPASYPVSTRDFPLTARGKADYSPPPIAEVKKIGAIPSLPSISSWKST